MVTLTLSPLYAKILLRALRQCGFADFHPIAEIIGQLENQT